MPLRSIEKDVPDWLMQPLILEPYLRPMPWGGKRLAQWLGLPEPDHFIGEAWLVSDHPLHTSRVVNVPSDDCTLRTLMASWPEAIAGYKTTRFPLLVKIIEARENLSIQVHPDDESAQQWAPQEGGKTEAWLVLETTPEGKIYLGLRPGITRDVLLREIPLGTLPLCLNTYTPEVGECYYVPAGTIHALGAGVCVLEVQQTSDATFRLYDWGRLDAQGKPRPLHREAGLAVLREYTPEAGPQKPVRLTPDSEQLLSCPYFTLYRLSISPSNPVHGPAIVIPLSSKVKLVSTTANLELSFGWAALIPAVLSGTYLACSEPGQVILITWPNPVT